MVGDNGRDMSVGRCRRGWVVERKEERSTYSERKELSKSFKKPKKIYASSGRRESKKVYGGKEGKWVMAWERAEWGELHSGQARWARAWAWEAERGWMGREGRRKSPREASAESGLIQLIWAVGFACQWLTRSTHFAGNTVYVRVRSTQYCIITILYVRLRLPRSCFARRSHPYSVPWYVFTTYSIFINIIQLIPRNYVSIGSSANTPNGEQRIVWLTRSDFVHINAT